AITEYRGHAPCYDIADHRPASRREYTHHDARHHGQPIGQRLHRAGASPQAGDDGIAMRLHDIPGSAWESDETRNQSAGNSQDEMLRWRQRCHLAAVDEEVANHAAAQGGKQRVEKETNDVIATLSSNRSADDPHQ